MLQFPTKNTYRKLQENKGIVHSGGKSGDAQFSLNGLRKFSRLCQTMAIFIPDTLRGQVFQAKDIERHTSQEWCAVILAVESPVKLGEFRKYHL